MNAWCYEIRDRESHKVILQDSGFDTEQDAEEQGRMEAKAMDLKNWYVVTAQRWMDI